MKIKTITLTHFPIYVPFSTDKSEPAWRVDQVTDSTEFAPGDFLRKPQVDELCEAKAWKVTIKREKI